MVTPATAATPAARVVSALLLRTASHVTKTPIFSYSKNSPKLIYSKEPVPAMTRKSIKTLTQIFVNSALKTQYGTKTTSNATLPVVPGFTL